MSVRLFVVDTHVLVAGLITAQATSPTATVLDAMLDGRLLYLLSPELLAEYRTVLLRPRLVRTHGLSEDEIDRLLAEIAANALWREPPPSTRSAAPDPGDDHLWALLGTEPGAMLVTGDKLLLDNPPPGSPAITASACAVVLGSA